MHPQHPSHIYYDGDCCFCKRWVSIIQRVLGITNHSQIIPGQSDPKIEALMAQQKSWIVVDTHGQAHWEFKAFIILAQQSYWLKWFTPIFQSPLGQYLGRRLYRWVANNRQHIDPFSRCFKGQ